MFFSGSFFPLATPSSIEDHISFFASELLGLSGSLEEETCVYVEVLLFVEAIVGSCYLPVVSGGEQSGDRRVRRLVSGVFDF